MPNKCVLIDFGPVYDLICVTICLNKHTLQTTHLYVLTFIPTLITLFFVPKVLHLCS